MLKLALMLQLCGCLDFSDTCPPVPDNPPSVCDWDYWYDNLEYTATRACTVRWDWSWGNPWPDGSVVLYPAIQEAVASPVWSLGAGPYHREGVLVVNADDSCVFTECL